MSKRVKIYLIFTKIGVIHIDLADLKGECYNGEGDTMRLKHVQGAEKIVESSAYVIQDPKEYRGRYNEVFQNNHPIFIEIGMGKGKFIIENALKYPMINFIGIEKYDSVLVRATQKIEKEIPNLRFIRMDASSIEEVFDREVDTIYLNFSDPWPKDRHAKRRLTSSYFLEKYDKIFKENKHIIMKTDNRHLFEYSLVSLTEYGYSICDLSLNLYEDEYLGNIATEYEEKFHAKGMPIYRVEVEKKN